MPKIATIKSTIVKPVTKPATLKCMLCLQKMIRSQTEFNFGEAQAEAQAEVMQAKLRSVPDAVSTTEHGGALCLAHFMKYNQ